MKATTTIMALSALLAATLAAWTSGAQESPARGSAVKKPNILVFMSDDHSWCDVGFNGNPNVKTPNLDKLASQGMRFNHCYTSSAVCAPTRFQFHSGHYPAFGRLYDNGPQVVRTLDFPTTASVLRDTGYRCVAIGKRHLIPESNYPFEFLTPIEHEWLSKKHTETATAFIRDVLPGENRPVFMLVASVYPHLEWGKADRSTYNPLQLTVPPYMPDTPNTREALASYYSRISDLDRMVGRVLEALEKSGKADNTLVIWTSEQGMQIPRAKWTACDLGLRTAFVARWPGRIQPGRQTDAFIQYVDVLPTLAEVAEGKAPPGIDGRSFLPVLLGQKDEHRDFVFGASGCQVAYSVRGRQYKYIWNSCAGQPFNYGFTDVGKGTREHFFEQQWQDAAVAGDATAKWIVDWIKAPPLDELYDVRKDPYELKNLAGDSKLAEVKTALRKQLRAWLAKQKDHNLGLFDKTFPEPRQ